MRKSSLISYEMIIAWRKSTSKPFTLQKLGFKAPAKFSLAYQEARRLTKLLISSGGLPKNSAKLIAVGAMNIMEDMRAEHAPWLKKRDDELKAQINQAQKTGKKLPNKDIKKLVTAKKADLTPISFSIKTDEKTNKKLPVKPKARIIKDVEPMIVAARPPTKKKVKVNAA
jgi:predicted metal-dependent hydrolase